MRLLLDTHVLLWWAGDDKRLSRPWRRVISDPEHDIFVSAISVAEIAIKTSLGKLTAPDELLVDLEDSGFLSLSFAADHAGRLRTLPWHHRDPFDRMLIAQAQVDELTVVTVDPQYATYRVDLLPH